MTIVSLRCTALPADIDGAAGIRQHGLTDALLDTFSSKLLWDEYENDAEIIPFTRDFPRADIHELISSDLLHQAIKGTFKDHLVDWVGEYLEITYEKAEAERILDEIDRRYAFYLY
jgi:Plavaka transposase